MSFRLIAFYIHFYDEQKVQVKLKEVCNYVRVTRRAVQGYEKAGLMTSIGTNKYGYLLYDDVGIVKTKKITQY